MIPRRAAGHATLTFSLLLLTVSAAVLVSRGRTTLEPVAAPQAAITLAAAGDITTASSFRHEDVVELARRLASEPPRPAAAVTPGLEKLGYDQYRDIRFNAKNAIWSDAGTQFRLDLLPAGSVYNRAVAVSTVENGAVTDLSPRAGMFDLGPAITGALRNQPLSLSGFRVRARVNSPGVWDEFLVFQGASYFRAVARGQNYGLSARGLALRTGEPEGEEFPSFTQFWIEKPARNATSLVVHALLESASVTGAYRFTVSTGTETRMDVSYTLFPRVDLRNVGIAPLTSMFLFNASNRSRFDDFRPAVHDSDGLMFVSRDGEQVWRQLGNSRTLQLSSYTAEQPRAFGLMQRARLFNEFQDLEASYERRPSAWVEFPEAGPPGPLRLIEIPTANETNDNIVAFWQPRDVLPAGQPFSGSYRLTWTAESLVPRDTGRFVATRIGTNLRGDRKLVVLDLSGAGTSPEGLELDVSASAGTVSNPLLHKNAAIRGLRASFEFDPAGAQLIEFRARVRRADEPVSETWLYRWTGT